MVKKDHLFAIASLLLVPGVAVLAGLMYGMIDPEIAAGHANYERNYRLLDGVRHLVLLAALGVSGSLWLLTCFFTLRSKAQSFGWLLLAVLGPFGFAVIAMLNDRAPTREDLYQAFVRRLGITLRIGYELCLFVATWFIAFQAMVLHRELMVMYQAATTGRTTQQIVDEQNASSGMWAFGEGSEVFYLVVLVYLLWPVVFNIARRVFG